VRELCLTRFIAKIILSVSNYARLTLPFRIFYLAIFLPCSIFSSGELDLWCTSSQFWEIGAGDEEEHAVTLFNYLYYIAMKRAAVVVAGGAGAGAGAGAGECMLTCLHLLGSLHSL